MENTEIMNTEVVENAVETANEVSTVPTNSTGVGVVLLLAAGAGLYALGSWGVKKVCGWLTNRKAKQPKVIPVEFSEDAERDQEFDDESN